MTGTVDLAGQLEVLTARHGVSRDALLPLLHDLQAQRGFIGEDCIRALAHALNLSRAEVYGVVSFYHDFRTQPEHRRAVKLCRAEACQARGADALAEAFQSDQVALETVYCLGLCAVGPNAMIGDQVYARLDAAKLAALAEEAR